MTGAGDNFSPTADGSARRGKPPPNASPPRRETRADDQSTLDRKLGPDRTSLRLLERHSRRACCTRSFQSTPCPSCCRCDRDCPHPEFGRVLEEVR